MGHISNKSFSKSLISQKKKMNLKVKEPVAIPLTAIR